MIKGNVSQTQFLQSSLISKANNDNVSRKKSYDNQDDDFKKILASKNDKQQRSTDSKVDSEDSKINSKDTEKSTNDEVKETKNSQEDVKEENVDKSQEESTLSQLNILIEDLIQTLQSSNIINGEKLEALVKEIENLVANLDVDALNMNAAFDLTELKTLVDNLNLINSSQLIDSAELKQMLEDKLDKLSRFIKTADTALNESNLESDNSLSIQNANADAANPNLENQNMSNNSEAEKELVNKAKTDSKGQENNISMEESSKEQFQVASKKNLNVDSNTFSNNDMDMAAIKNIEVDSSKNNQIFEMNKTLTNSNVKPDLNIFNQILDGTKLSISEDVSEMLLKLKPDNLGNLSMKISIERGMMVARFEVESQIVKEAIESNLEDLRNALSDKGFEVKEFNVSVNKDSDNQESSFSYFSKRKTKKKAMISNQFNDSYVSNQQTIDGINSSINYLA